LQSAVGLPVARVGGAICIATPGIPTTMLNRAMGVGLAEPASDAALDEIDAWFRGFGVQYAVAVSPSARPEDLAERLRERGFAYGYAWAKFARGVDDPEPVATELEVRPLASADEARRFGAVIARAYDMPPGLGEQFERLYGVERLHCFVAWDGDEAAGAAALHVGGEVGWFGIAGTAPEHRRKGAQNALMAARVRRARELGCTVLTTETGALEPGRPSNSYRNILRIGFELRFVRPNLVSPQ
jgi:GNAT superfamily N-acetyltransferase